MYSIRVLRTIWNVEREVWERGPQSNDPKIKPKVLSYQLSLPFTPFIGLQIFDSSWYCTPIDRIEWHVDKNEFICRVADEFPGEAGDMYLSFQDLCSLWPGWKDVV